MGKVRRRLSHRGLWLHARVIPAPFPSGKTGHISGAMDANMEWTRISDDQRPRAWKRGSPDPEPGDQPDHPPRQAPVKQQLFHKVPWREVRVPLPLLSFPDGTLQSRKREAEDGTEGAVRQVQYPA